MCCGKRSVLRAQSRGSNGPAPVRKDVYGRDPPRVLKPGARRAASNAGWTGISSTDTWSGADMHRDVGHPPWARWLGIGVASALTLLGGAKLALGNSPEAIVYVRPGMNQTELQSVLGPPDYVQANGRRQAWQYCPSRFFIRFLDA